MTQTHLTPTGADTVASLYEISALMRLMHENVADDYPALNYIWRSVGSSLEQSASCLDELLSENERLKQQLADCTEK